MSVKHLLGAICITAIMMFGIVGCSQSKTEPAETKPLGNEQKIFGINFAQEKDSLLNSLGKPDTKENHNYIYKEKKLTVSFNDSKIDFIKIKNPEYQIGKAIAIGESITTILEKEIRTTFYKYHSNQENPIVYFQKGDYKIVLNMKENQVESIILFQKETPFSTFIIGHDSDLTDRELKLRSEYLNFHPNVVRNNRRVVSEDFSEFAKMGLVDAVPVPLGMEEDELIRRYDDGEFIFTELKPFEKSKYYLFYREFGVYFGIKDKKVEEIVIPVTLKENELLAALNFKNNVLTIDESIQVRYAVGKDRVENMVISTKK
jgi:cupin superfamily acireductone dioxygenase involved in methionine salvage